MPKERILVIRLGALGDLVLCFQAFHDIRAAHPEAEIALLTMPTFAGFARQMPWFDRVLVDERPAFRDLRTWHTLIGQVRAFAPTRVYDLQGKFRQNLLYAALGGPFSVAWSGAAPLCSHPRVWPPTPDMHFTDFVAAQLRRANVSPAAPPDLTWLDAPVENLAPKPYALLIPSCAAGRAYKRWPTEKYAALARHFHQQGVTCLATGTRADADTLAALRQQEPSVQDGTGQTNLFQFAHLARHAVCVVGNDTGPTHLAAAVGAATVALMSDRVNPVWSAPRGPRTVWRQGRPLENLTVEEVLLALKELIDTNNLVKK